MADGIKPLSEYSSEERSQLSQQECVQSLDMAPEEVKLMPPKWRTEAMIVRALRAFRDGENMEDMLPHLLKYEFTKFICDMIVNQFPNGRYFGYIPDRYKTNEMCKNAVAMRGYDLGYIPEQLQTEEICVIAIKHYPAAIAYVNRQTRDLCILSYKISLHRGSDFGIYHLFDEKLLTVSLFNDLIDVYPSVVYELDSEDLWKVLPKLVTITREVCMFRARDKVAASETRGKPGVLSRIKCGRLRRCIVRTLTVEKLSTLRELQLSTLSMAKIVAVYATTNTFGPMHNDHNNERIRFRMHVLGISRLKLLSWSDCWDLALLVKKLSSE
ncbi:MAG: hypothetical protein WC052_05585 [Patescibacteria group bacterium]